MREQLSQVMDGRAFDGVVRVVLRKDILYEGAFGDADKENALPNTLKTLFPVGSISKPVTAVAIMQLIGQGKLQLNTLVESFWPWFYPGSGITIHHLLSHTSGVANYIMFQKELPWLQEYTPEDILKAMAKKRLGFTPGKKWAYTNTGFLALGRIVEMVSGKPYHQYVRDHIFTPAGMANSGFVGDDLDDIAKMYIKGQPGPSLQPTHMYACGDLVTTVADLQSFHQALGSGALLTPELESQMQQPAHKGSLVQYGYGWFTPTIFGRRVVSHGGSHPSGATAHIDRFVDDDLVFIVLSNNYVSQAPLTLKEVAGTVLSRELACAYFDKRLPFYKKMM